jgi:hypothetical protein
MRKATARLSDLNMDRLATRRAPEPPPPEPQSEIPAASGPYQQPGRKGAKMIAGHFPPSVSFTLQEALAKVSREQNKRVTVQDAVAEGLRLFFEKHGITPPAELMP